ncbi:MAG: Gfo/Idh/MocA family oxidoreductase [Methylocella sp.]
MTAESIAVGLLGVGKIARDQHVPALSRNPRYVLAATASHDHGVNRIDKIPSYPSLAAMLEAVPNLGAVALCVPPAPRYALARAALLAGKHVLLEKPPGASTSEVHHLIELARERSLCLFAAWHSQFAPAPAVAKAWLAGRKIRSARIIWKEDVNFWHPGQEWIWEPGGFGVFDPGINALSIASVILPGDLSVASATLIFPENRQTPIAARLSLRLDDVVVEAEFDWRQTGPQTWDITVETDAGQLHLSKGGGALTLAGKAAILPPEAEYDGVYERFATLIDQRRIGVDARPLHLVADAHLIAAREIAKAFY